MVMAIDQAKNKENFVHYWSSVHILCECEALASLIHTYLGFFFLDPEDIRKLSTGANWNFAKKQGSFNLEHGAQRACFKA
jgi:hypothetical protein